MPGTELFLPFLAAAAVFAYMPGPSTLYAATQTLVRGKRAGWMAALGLHVGGYVHVLAAAFGLAVLFQAIPILYATMKFVGAGYLIYLGARMVLDRDATVEGTDLSTDTTFKDSAIVEILNPKTAIFYLAFLPQFVSPDALWPIWAQLLILGTIVNIMFSSADAICVLLAARVSQLMRKKGRTTAVLNSIGGTILIGLGLRLAMDRP